MGVELRARTREDSGGAAYVCRTRRNSECWNSRNPLLWLTPQRLSPAQEESAGKRRDGGMSREGSVQLRRTLRRLTAASSDAQSVGEESRKGAYLAPRSRAFCEGVALHRGMSNVRAVHVLKA
jgi:hypothetical protein